MSDEKDEIRQGPDALPRDRDETAYERARNVVSMSLSLTEERLRELRKKRDEINAEIKVLVNEESLLQRMSKIEAK